MGPTMLRRLICCLVLIVAPATLDAQRSANPNPAGRIEGAAEREVRIAEAARFHAMIRGDLRALDSLLASELTYTHTDGKRQNKAEFQEMLRSGELRYLGAELT